MDSKIELWDGQAVVSKTTNGYVIYPKLGPHILSDEMAVVEGSESFGKIGTALKNIYLGMDARKKAFDDFKESQGQLAEQSTNAKLEPVPMTNNKQETNNDPVGGVQQDKEEERRLV